MLARVFSLAVGAPRRRAAIGRPTVEGGWDALNAGRIQEAAAAFDEALRTRARSRPSTLLGAGVAARLQGRNDDARRLLVDALKIEPSLTSASLLLGSVLYQTGDLDGAIETYQRALALESESPAADQTARSVAERKRTFTAASVRPLAITSP